MSTPALGVVIIGRNEGERLTRCLKSVSHFAAVVYVDSNSSDDSVAMAKRMGVAVVELDLSEPFSAARARNEGFERLMQLYPGTNYVQFADGDCEIVAGWMELALSILEQSPELAVVAGRRRERHPKQSIYNRLCDLEWNTPVGDAKACGGDALIRSEALSQAGGYNPSVIAGEEPELCVRMRAAGWKIRRLDAEMTLHDAAMTRAKQWWRRMQRSGHAYAQGASMHGQSPEFHWVREQRSICFWGAAIPLSSLALAWPSMGVSLLLLCGYPVLVLRVYRYYLSRGFSSGDARLAAIFDVVAKFPQFVGIAVFRLNQIRSKNTTLIEYKGATQ